MDHDSSLKWVEAHRVVDAENAPGVVVVISKLPIRTPKFSMRLGLFDPKNADNLKSFIKFANSHNPEGLIPGTIAPLVAEAEEWISAQQDAAMAEQARLAEESREKALAKKKRYLENVERRKEENRQSHKKKG